MQPDWTAADVDYNVLVAWTHTVNSTVYRFRFALGRTVHHPYTAYFSRGLGATADLRGTYCNNLYEMSDLHQCCLEEGGTKAAITLAETTLRIARDGSQTIEDLIACIDGSNNFAEIIPVVVPVFVCRPGEPIDPETDCVFFGCIPPNGARVYQDRIELRLEDPAGIFLEKNVLDIYTGAIDGPTPDLNDRYWLYQPTPRLYGRWGGYDGGHHRPLGLRLCMVNSGKMPTSPTPTEIPQWPIFRIADFRDRPMGGLFPESDEHPDMVDDAPKVFAFWSGPVAYDIWVLHKPTDPAFPFEEGYVQACRSIREGGIETPHGVDVVDLGGTCVELTTSNKHGYQTNDIILVQDMAGGTLSGFSNQWHRITRIDDYTFYLQGVLSADYTGPYIGGGYVVMYYPAFKPGEDSGSRDTEEEVFRLQFPDHGSETCHVFHESRLDPGSPMENPAEIWYDILRNLAGVPEAMIDSGYLSVYLGLEGGEIKARRFVWEQTTVRDLLESLCTDFGLVTFTHAGKFHLRYGRIHSSEIGATVATWDILRNSYVEVHDRSSEALPAGDGVQLLYDWDQGGDHHFTNDDYTSISAQFDAGQQSPAFNNAGTNTLAPWRPDGNNFFQSIYYPNSQSGMTYRMIKTNWVYDDDTAINLSTVLYRAICPTASGAPGLTGCDMTIVFHLMDPRYMLADEVEYFHYQNRDYAYAKVLRARGMVYERTLQWSEGLVKISMCQ